MPSNGFGGPRSTATPEEFELLQEQATKLEQLVDGETQAGEDAVQRQQVDAATLVTTQGLITELEGEIAKLSEIEAEAELSRASVEEQRQDVADLQTRVAEAQQALAAVKVELDNTPVPDIPDPKIVRLPNPREVPKNWTEVLFICQHGRIVKLDPGAMLVRAQGAIEQMARGRVQGRLQFSRDADTPSLVRIDCSILVDAFKKRRVGSSVFRTDIQVKNGVPYLTYMGPRRCSRRRRRKNYRTSIDLSATRSADGP